MKYQKMDHKSSKILKSMFLCFSHQNRLYKKFDAQLFMDVKQANNQIKLKLQKERICQLIKKRQEIKHQHLEKARRHDPADDEIMDLFFYN